jgi:hypothetical protein
MSAVEVPFGPDESAAVQAAAAAAGVTVTQFVRDAALQLADPLQKTFLRSGEHHRRIVADAFADGLPADSSPAAARRRAEQDAAGQLAAPDARGNAA